MKTALPKSLVSALYSTQLRKYLIIDQCNLSLVLCFSLVTIKRPLSHDWSILRQDYGNILVVHLPEELVGWLVVLGLTAL